MSPPKPESRYLATLQCVPDDDHLVEAEEDSQKVADKEGEHDSNENHCQVVLLIAPGAANFTNILLGVLVNSGTFKFSQLRLWQGNTCTLLSHVPPIKLRLYIFRFHNRGGYQQSRKQILIVICI